MFSHLSYVPGSGNWDYNRDMPLGEPGGWWGDVLCLQLVGDSFFCVCSFGSELRDETAD